jgi:hypothetical protein
MATRKPVKTCPECGGIIHYVMRAIERYTIYEMPDQTGYTDLENLVDTNIDDSFDPYLECSKCLLRADLTKEKVSWERIR